MVAYRRTGSTVLDRPDATTLIWRVAARCDRERRPLIAVIKPFGELEAALDGSLFLSP